MSNADPSFLNREFSVSGTFLVTGGTRGIGRAISIQLARAGASVIANYAREDAAAAEVKALADHEHLRIEVCRADLCIPKGLRQIEIDLEKTGDPLKGLVHCAATGTHRPITELTGRHLDWTFALNVRAFFELVSLLLPKMGSGSSILALSSAGATRAVPSYTVVGVSKGALESLVRHLAAELGPRGIRVNALAPGPVATDAWKAIPESQARFAEAASRSPLRRLVTREEVAMAAQFLCSPAAAGISGQTLTVDGGAGIAAWG
jgi:enoyl-[acyl-carrier protein] reductase III